MVGRLRREAARGRLAARSRTKTASGWGRGPEKANVLVFIAVGNSSRTLKRMVGNIAKLKTSGIHADVFLAHYDKGKQEWLSRNEPWYTRNVDFNVEVPGYKFQIARQVLPAHLTAHDNYDWVWLLDEDVDISRTNIAKMFELASRSRALVAQPALYVQFKKPNGAKAPAARRPPAVGAAPAVSALQLDVRRVETRCQAGEAMCYHTAPHPECRYRYSNIVEVMAPMLRPRALLRLFQECHDCIQEKSVWGLDLIWCNWLARQFGKDNQTTCAIVDQTTIFHDNQKTLNKWTAQGSRNMTVIKEDYWGAWHNAKAHHPDDFIENYGRTLGCVRY